METLCGLLGTALLLVAMVHPGDAGVGVPRAGEAALVRPEFLSPVQGPGDRPVALGIAAIKADDIDGGGESECGPRPEPSRIDLNHAPARDALVLGDHDDSSIAPPKKGVKGALGGICAMDGIPDSAPHRAQATSSPLPCTSFHGGVVYCRPGSDRRPWAKWPGAS